MNAGSLKATVEILEQIATEIRSGLYQQRVESDAAALRLDRLTPVIDALPGLLTQATRIVEATGRGELVTAGEMAERIRVNVQTIRRWARDGIIPGYQMGPGGDWRFDVAEVISAVKQLSTEVAACAS